MSDTPDRPANDPSSQQIIDFFKEAGLFPHNDYASLPAVHEFAGVPYKVVVDAVLSNELQHVFVGDIPGECEGLPFTRWVWVDEWLAKRNGGQP